MALQDCSSSSALAVELLLPYTKPSTYGFVQDCSYSIANELQLRQS